MNGHRVQLLPLATGATVMGAALLVLSTMHRPDIALSLVVLGVPLTLVERWRPLRRQRSAIRRAGAMTDAVSYVVNEVLAGLGLVVVLAVTVPLIRLGVPPAVHEWTSALPGWGRWLLAFVVSEVCGYWGHRLSHEIPALWSLHRVHHSAPELDWLAPSRRHPLDALIARTSTALPVLVLGLGVPTVVTWFALKRLQGLIVHANIDVRLGVLERVIVTPCFHHWHHSDEPGTWNTNYAGSIPAVDWLFGTLLLPDRWPAAYGCGTAVPDVGYVARCLSPWRDAELRSNEPKQALADVSDPAAAEAASNESYDSRFERFGGCSGPVSFASETARSS